ncbi:MAG: penicillin acylase family protein, partial [Pseudomonadales bacterium]|nr:penicillin acylase family protein [Pseudomonadales bacterium]
IAWGGTNMRGISSHLIDVSDLPPEQIEVRTEKLKSRWWFDREISIRETPFGPILTDLDYFDSSEQPNTVALDWLGYRGSDEIGAFLKVARARNWDEYRLAYEHYAISAMNMLYADRLGNIGMIPAYRQPVLRDQTKTLDLVKTSTNTLVGYIKPIDQPNPYNPDAGYILSANNKPFSYPVIPYGYGFANNDRIDRLHTWMDQHPTVSVAELESLQLDVYSRTAHDLAQWLTTAVSSHDFGTQQYILDKIAHWDGRFNWDNVDAVAFEVTMYYAWQDYVDEHAQSPAMQSYLSGYGNWRPTLLAWFRTLPSEQLINYLSDWLANSDGAVEHYPNWGQFHRQGQAPILGNIPVIGKRFALENYPASGGNDTLFKSGRPFSPDAQSVTYGSSARHISDMSSPDENYFVLHGGQDGWYGSPNLADQTALWRAGEYIRIPLTMENVKRQFNRHVTRLHAGHAEQE